METKNRTVSEIQKNFLLEYFFKNEDYAGWNVIASTLIKEGLCLVAGNECIWMGGIGNFITTKSDHKTIHAFDCLEYQFDLDNFLTSEWYKEVKTQYVLDLLDKKNKAEQMYKEISTL